MSRSSNSLAVYQIEVLDFSVKRYLPLYYCDQCHWEGQRPSTNNCPKCGNKIIPQNRIKDSGVLVPPTRTLLRQCKDGKHAKRWGERFGTVVSCHKVDTSVYFANIEHLNLHQEPIEISIEQDFVLNRALELEKPHKRY